MRVVFFRKVLSNDHIFIADRAIPDDPRYTLLPSGTLRLLRVQPGDAGIFRCEAANAVGIQHAQVTLTVVRRTPFDFVR